MFERTKSFFGCLVIEADEIVQEMKRRGMPSGKIAQAVNLWLENEDSSLLIHIDSASTTVFLSTPAMARTGWEIPISIGGYNMTRDNGRYAKCPECAADVEMPRDPIKGEIVECPECGVELEVIGLDPSAVGIAPQEDEDWGE